MGDRGLPIRIEGTRRALEIINGKEKEMKKNTFPNCCFNKFQRGETCPHYYTYNLSIDDMVYGCKKLNMEYNYCDDLLKVGSGKYCPLEIEEARKDLENAIKNGREHKYITKEEE